MTTYFVSRHPGALEWAERQGVDFDWHLRHLEGLDLRADDVVIGILPVHVAARACAAGARFLNISLDVPEQARGGEYCADDLERFGARLEEFLVAPVERGAGVAVHDPSV